MIQTRKQSFDFAAQETQLNNVAESVDFVEMFLPK